MEKTRQISSLDIISTQKCGYTFPKHFAKLHNIFKLQIILHIFLRMCNEFRKFFSKRNNKYDKNADFFVISHFGINRHRDLYYNLL